MSLPKFNQDLTDLELKLREWEMKRIYKASYELQQIQDKRDMKY